MNGFRTGLIRISTLLTVAGVVTGCSNTAQTASLTSGGGAAAGNTLSASGFIEAEEVSVVAEAGGRVAEVRVDEADPVTAGQIVVVLDDGLLQADRMQALAAVQAAEASLAALLAEPTDAEIDGAQAIVDEAQAALDGAQRAAQQAWSAVYTPHEIDIEIAATQLALTETSAQIEALQQQLDEIRFEIAQVEDVDEGEPLDVTRLDFLCYTYEQVNAELAAAQALHNGNAEKLALLEAQRRWPLALVAQAHQADSQAMLAERQAALAQAQYDVLLADPRSEEIAIAEAQIALAEAQVALIDARIARLSLIAPISGVVTTRSVAAGETATAGIPLLTITNLETLRLVVYIPETQIGLVSLGAPAGVTVDAYPDEIFIGRVTQVGREAEFTPRNVQTEEERVNLVFAVEITIGNSDGRLKPGMPADVQIEP
jgi:HlyD family secretion protein